MRVLKNIEDATTDAATDATDPPSIDASSTTTEQSLSAPIPSVSAPQPTNNQPTTPQTEPTTNLVSSISELDILCCIPDGDRIMRCFALPVRDITTDDQLFERLNELYKEVRDWRYFFGLCRVSRITCGRAVPDILNSTSIRKISLTLLKCCLHQFICYGSKYADYSFRTDPEGPPLPTEMPYYDYYQFDPKAWINTPQSLVPGNCVGTKTETAILSKTNLSIGNFIAVLSWFCGVVEDDRIYILRMGKGILHEEEASSAKSIHH
ncbi:hypothetical protein FPQ18DRAFT_381707 [Pyronema domesticum]|nr:hypothetical protein FPQ18DRAFT_381707 [Pyronema domesticum]